MSIRGLFKHQVEVWRPTQTRGEFREVIDDFDRVTVPTRNNAEPVPPNMRLEDPGPGEASAGRVTWYMDRMTDVEEQDVLKVTAGPEAPSLWRVVSKAFPRAHHFELVVEPWHGTLPEEEAS